MPPAWVCVLPMVVLLAMAPLQPTRAFCASRKSAYHRMTSADFDTAYAPINDPEYLDPRAFLATNLHYTKYPTDTVIGVVVGARALAFPVKIMRWHKVVNDNDVTSPVTVTYSPMAGASVAFTRNTTDSTFWAPDFAASNRVYDNTLVIKDHASNTNWAQMYGIGLDGTHECADLHMATMTRMSLEGWWTLHPNTLVLKVPDTTGVDYGTSPMGADYATDEDLYYTGSYNSAVPPYSLHHAKARSLAIRSIAPTPGHGGDDTGSWVLVGINSLVALMYTQTPPPPEATVDSSGNPVMVPPRGAVMNGDFTVVYHHTHRAMMSFRTPIPDIGGRLGFRLSLDDSNSNGFMKLKDIRTQSLWDASGRCVSGVRKGEQLPQAVSYAAYWFAVTSVHPYADICGVAYCAGSAGYQNYRPFISYGLVFKWWMWGVIAVSVVLVLWCCVCAMGCHNPKQRAYWRLHMDLPGAVSLTSINEDPELAPTDSEGESEDGGADADKADEEAFHLHGDGLRVRSRVFMPAQMEGGTGQSKDGGGVRPASRDASSRRRRRSRSPSTRAELASVGAGSGVGVGAGVEMQWSTTAHAV